MFFTTVHCLSSVGSPLAPCHHHDDAGAQGQTAGLARPGLAQTDGPCLRWLQLL